MTSPKNPSEQPAPSPSPASRADRETTLLPCPFCGAAADFRWSFGGESVECTGCEAEFAGDTFAEAAALWNRRASLELNDPPLYGSIDRYAAVLDARRAMGRAGVEPVMADEVLCYLNADFGLPNDFARLAPKDDTFRNRARLILALEAPAEAPARPDQVSWMRAVLQGAAAFEDKDHAARMVLNAARAILRSREPAPLDVDSRWYGDPSQLAAPAEAGSAPLSPKQESR